VALRGAGRR